MMIYVWKFAQNDFMVVKENVSGRRLLRKGGTMLAMVFARAAKK